jgi:hypothetical protein
MSILFKSLTLAALLLALGCHASAHAGEVIAHPSVTLNADEVKELFFGDKQLAGNQKLVPIDNAAQQADFLARVLHSDGAKYAARWTKKAFREGLTAPTHLGSDAETIAFVKSTPGAVACIAGPSSGVKVLHKY